MRPRVLPKAFEEALQAALWYDEQRAGLGDEFYDEVLKSLESVGRTPLRHPIYEAIQADPPFRRARVKRFPYYVIYRFNQVDAEPFVIAICHASQRPGYWGGRGRCALSRRVSRQLKSQTEPRFDALNRRPG